jgi:hypothetical protein
MMIDKTFPVFGVVMAVVALVGSAAVAARYFASRPLTCEMGMMKPCPGGGIQFCQKTYYTSCYKMEVDH